jgi:hypothetical protein
LDGRVIRSSASATKEIPLGELSAGVYFVHTGTSVVRIVKE